MMNRHRNALFSLWLVAGILVLLTWTHVFSLVNESRQREISNARSDLANLTRLSQEHANRTFRSADQVIRFVQSRYLEMGNRLDLVAMTAQGVIDVEIFNQVGIIDANGIYALANRPITTRIDLSDREHFRVHVAKDTGELFISKPVIGRATGLWSIQLTRRITRPDDSFGGVVVLSIDPSYFTRFYSELNLGPGGLNSLYGLDGIARARRVGDRTEYGTDASASELFSKLLKAAPSGSYTQNSVVDNIERLMFYRKISKYPLVTIAGVDMRYLLANQKKATDALHLQAGVVTALILALAAGMTHHLWLLRRESVRRRLAQEQIEDRKEQLDTLFRLSPDGFVSFDKNQCVRFVNPAFSQMTGLDATALDGLDATDFSALLCGLCVPSAAFVGMQSMQALANTNPAAASQTIELHGPGRRTLQVQVRLSNSSTVSQILYVRDVTHETEVEMLKSDFLATAAHELRTPMASIFGFAEILLTHSCDAASQREFLEIIHKQSKLMVQILNELLDLARIEARRGKDFHYTRLCLQALLGDLLMAFQCPLGRTAPELVAPTEPIYLMADSGKLRQALLNVVSNAYKYSPDGGPVQVRVELPLNPDSSGEVAIHVSDHGLGISAEQAGKVFTRFYRADPSGKVPGTGLGMSITKEIIEHHKGRISIVSALGEGSSFSLYLPLPLPQTTEH